MSFFVRDIFVPFMNSFEIYELKRYFLELFVLIWPFLVKMEYEMENSEQLFKHFVDIFSRIKRKKSKFENFAVPFDKFRPLCIMYFYSV